MRNSILFILSIILFVACKDQPMNTEKSNNNQKPAIAKNIPADLVKVFDAHGTLDKWNEMNSLSYEIVKKGGNEMQLIDLKSRNERIEGSTFKTGYNGKEYWLEADTSYKRDPKFYHNLMFYFYAMPFVLADDGIVYNKVEPLVYEEKSYPGYRISYNQGVGISPEDEYFIHYNPTTYQMEWLGYTVTFFSGKKSKKVKYIRYNDWLPLNGLVLPKSLTWHNMEEGVIAGPKDPTVFAKIKITKEQTDPSSFDKTANAKIVD